MKRLVGRHLLTAALIVLATAPARAGTCFSDRVSWMTVVALGLGEDAAIHTAAKHQIKILMPEFAATRREYFADWNRDDPLTICEHPDAETGTTHLVTDDRIHQTYPATLDAGADSRVCLHGADGGAICRGP